MCPSYLGLDLERQLLRLGLCLALWCFRGCHRAIATLLCLVVSSVVLRRLALAAARDCGGSGRGSASQRSADSLNFREDRREVGFLLDLGECLAVKVVLVREDDLDWLWRVPYALSGVDLVSSAHSPGDNIPVLEGGVSEVSRSRLTVARTVD